MLSSRFFIHAFGCTVLCVSCITSTLFGQILRAGADERVFTPPDNSFIDSFPLSWNPVSNPRVADGSHDPIMVKSVVLQEGDVLLSLTSCDFVILREGVTSMVKTMVSDRIPIDPENIIIGVTHNHNSPAQGEDFGIPIQTELRRILAETITETIVTAYNKRLPARLGAGRGFIDLSFNRRFRNRDGNITRIRENPNRRYYGPVDYEVGILRIDELEGDNIATLVNYATHVMVMGGKPRQFTADFPGAMAKSLSQKIGRYAKVLFFNGALGNIVPYEVEADDWDVMKSVGEQLADEVYRVYRTIQTNPKPGLRIAHRTLPFQSRYEGETGEARTHMIFTNDAVIATNGGELFVELGLEFKRRAPYLHSFVFGLTDGALGYIPHREAYEFGGYGCALHTGTESRRTQVPIGFGETLLDTWLDMLHSENPDDPGK
jgi:neutral ceramidase